MTLILTEFLIVLGLCWLADRVWAPQYGVVIGVLKNVRMDHMAYLTQAIASAAESDIKRAVSVGYFGNVEWANSDKVRLHHAMKPPELLPRFVYEEMDAACLAQVNGTAGSKCQHGVMLYGNECIKCRRGEE